MLFIGAAIVIAIGLVLLIVSDAGTLIGLSQDQFGRLIPLLVILLFIAAGLFSRQR
jgi:aspartyl protease family protein